MAKPKKRPIKKVIKPGKDIIASMAMISLPGLMTFFIGLFLGFAMWLSFRLSGGVGLVLPNWSVLKSKKDWKER